MKHTKGEWYFGHGVGIATSNQHIADITPTNSFDETLANAKLIAAAPELLEALYKFTVLDEEYFSSIKGLIQNAKEIIKKATE